MLAIYALWATVALYRSSRRSVSAIPVANVSIPAAPSPVRSTTPSKIEASTVAAALPSRPAHALSRGRAASESSPSEPGRPVIQAAPTKFDYPVMTGGGSGRVYLKLLIGTTGMVESVKVLAGSPNLASAAVRAARSWRYQPLVLNGQRVLAEAHVRMSFVGDEAVSINFRE